MHPEIRSSKVITEKHTLFITTIVSRIYCEKMFTRQVSRDIRTKNMKNLDQIVTQFMGLKMIELALLRQTVGVRPVGIDEQKLRREANPTVMVIQ
jgi:hypothetical protein